jgi:hypothetical protein
VKENKAKICGLVAILLLLLLLSPGLPGAKSTLKISVVVSASGSINSPPPTSGPLWLHTSGQNVYDSNSKQVKLYAINIFYGGHQHVTLSDIQKIKNMGFNAVRIMPPWQSLQPNGPNSIDTTFFTDTTGSAEPAGIGMDSIVKWCADNGLYVIICPVYTTWWTPPSWVPLISGTTVGQWEGDGSPGPIVNLLGDTTVQAGVNYFYNWMGQHYAKNSNVIFESFNELLMNQNEPNSDAGTPFANFNNGWVSAIENGENSVTGGVSHLKIIEALWNWNWQYQFTAPYVAGTHSNIIVATHNYDSYSSADTTGVVAKITGMANAVHASNLPWIDTEFAKDISQSGWQNWYTTVLSAFKNLNIVGWADFMYCSDTSAQTGWNLNNPTTGPQVLPYLQQYMTQP